MTTFNSNGASIDSYAETRQKIATAVKSVLGEDMKTDDEDAVVGKIVTIAANVAHDANQCLQHAVAVRDPDSASGVGLAKLVKLNGITKNAAKYSTVVLSVVSNAYGTSISSGDKVFDPDNPEILWSIDSGTVLAPYSTGTVSATCETEGAIPALAGTLTAIKTPRQGWSTVTNSADAVLGASAETDPALRRRRERVARSYGKSTLYGVWATLEDYDDVTDVFVHENKTNAVDAFGVPGRSMEAFVRGGSDSVIAEILFRTAPCATHGDTTVSYEYRGKAFDISFSRPTDTPIEITINMSPISTIAPTAFPGSGEESLKQAIVNYAEANQLMGVDAIPQQFAAACSGIIPGWYVSAVLINSSPSVVSANMGEAFTVSTDDITVTH